MKKKNLLYCLFTLILTLLLANYAGALLNPPESDDCINSIKAFHSLENNSLDVIVYGSSHAWKGFDANEMTRNYGIETYNYGCNWQNMNTTLLFLKDSLRTQSPKVVLIDTYKVNLILEDVDMIGEIYYTKAISDFDGKRKFLKQCFGNNLGRYISYYFPLAMFHENWNQITEENFNPGIMVETWLENRGYFPSTVAESITLGNYLEFSQDTLDESALKILDDIIETCSEKNIKVIFFTCPYGFEYRYSDAMTAYASEHDCEYINLFAHLDDMGFDGDTDFRDTGHLNDSGAKKVANFLGAYIVEKYGLEAITSETSK